MAGSGVMRKRLAQRGGGANPREGHGITDISGLRGTAQVHVKTNVDVGSDLAPKKFRPFETTRGAYKITPAPTANTMDGKGEGGHHRKVAHRDK